MRRVGLYTISSGDFEARAQDLLSGLSRKGGTDPSKFPGESAQFELVKDDWSGLVKEVRMASVKLDSFISELVFTINLDGGHTSIDLYCRVTSDAVISTNTQKLSAYLTRCGIAHTVKDKFIRIANLKGVARLSLIVKDTEFLNPAIYAFMCKEVTVPFRPYSTS